MPSRPGIRISISSTSGRCWAAARRTACLPVGRLAGHLDVVLGIEQRGEAGPHQHPGHRPARPVIDRLLSRHHRPVSIRGSSARTRKPPPWARARVQRAAERAAPARSCPRCRCRQSRPVAGPAGPGRGPGRRCRRRPPRPTRSSLPVAERDTVAVLPAGVPRAVGQCLLDDPVGGQIHLGGQRPPAAPSCSTRTASPAAAARAHQVGEPGQAGARRQGARPRPGIAEHAKHRAAARPAPACSPR